MKDVQVNSELTTIRSLIVLLFLIGLPLIAIMPEGVQGALNSFLPESESDSPAASIPPVRPADELASFPVLSATSPTSQQNEPLTPVSRVTDYEAPLSQAADGRNNSIQPTKWEIPAEVASHSGGMPTFSRPDTDPIDDLPLPSDRLTAPQIPSTGMINENTTDLQAELDRLGATYYRLESWGNAQRVYRFHCTVTIKIGLAEYSRRFEATAESPESAMQQVRNEVQSWHDRFSNSNQSFELDGNAATPL